VERYTSKVHFSRLSETSDEVKKYVKGLSNIKKYSKFLQSEYIWGKRILSKKSRFLRPLIVRNVFEMIHIGNKSWIDYLDIISSVELFNISTYQSDRVFDFHNVQNNTSFEEEKNDDLKNFILSYIIYSLASEIISSSSNLKESIRNDLLTQIITAGQKIYEGQLADIFMLNKGYNSDILNYSEQSFLEKYLTRCKFLDGYQFAMCFSFGLILGSADPSEQSNVKNSLLKIGENFGICLQILNDMADLSCSNKENYLEDVLNKKITYPIYLLWNQSAKGRDFLKCIWENSNMPNINKYKSEVRQILNNNQKITIRMLKLLWMHFKKILSEINEIKKGNIKSIQMLDFIYPHIFLSRILKGFFNCRNDLYNQLEYLKRQENLDEYYWIKE